MVVTPHFAVAAMVLLAALLTCQPGVPLTEATHVEIIVWYVNPDPFLIAGASPKYVIVDPDYGPDGREWETWMINLMKETGTKVIAYLNIGLAESWRDYWVNMTSENMPSWLTMTEYPDWPGEYFVKYWKSGAWGPGGWVELLHSEIEKIIDLGFDGVLLDNVDVCNYWSEPDELNINLSDFPIENATQYMVKLVANISEYAKLLRKDFVIIANVGGAVDLVANPQFISAIDGVMREDVWYVCDEPQDPSETLLVLNYLRLAGDVGKEVIVVEYASNPHYQADALVKAEQCGFLIYVTQDLELSIPPTYLTAYFGHIVGGKHEACINWPYATMVMPAHPYAVNICWSLKAPVRNVHHVGTSYFMV